MTEDALVEEQFRQAYAQWEATANPLEKAEVHKMMRQAHAEAAGAAVTGDAPDKLQHRALTYALSAATSTPAPAAPTAMSPAPAARPLTVARLVEPHLLPERRGVSRAGKILGDGPYEFFDHKWLLAAASWLQKKPPAPLLHGDPVVLEVPDDVTIGILGDWGTGDWEPNAPPQLAASVMAARGPQITIHLGDEYYAGRLEEESRFAKEWPAGSLYSFALNSNHSMYSAGHEYLTQTLGHAKFATQKQLSCFAFYNSRWLFIGLDTAVGASWIDMFLKGRLEPIQIAFLSRLRAQFPDHRVALFTHHGPRELDGAMTGTLWDDVKGALGRLPSLWYYGHLHAAVAYTPVQGCFFRCVGHGAVPYGVARGLDGNKSIAWYETQSAGGSEPERCLNGGMLLSMSGAEVRETFFGEDGSERVTFRWDQNLDAI